MQQNRPQTCKMTATEGATKITVSRAAKSWTGLIRLREEKKGEDSFGRQTGREGTAEGRSLVENLSW